VRVMPLRRSARASEPGWSHPTLKLHEAWYSRRRLAWQARLALVALGVLVVPVVLGLPPALFALSLLAFLVPAPLNQAATLREIEARYGAAYTTALVAPPEDEFGFAQRLARQARTVAVNAELPPLPWLEALAGGLIVALALVLPGPISGRGPVAASAPTPYTLEEALQAPTSEDADPVLDAAAQSGAAAPAGSARGGKAANSGSAAETSVGEVSPGEGDVGAAGDPEAVTREYLEALERGSVRSSDPNASKGKGEGPTVTDRDRAVQQGQDGQEGEDGQSDQQGGAGQGKQKSGQGGPQGGSNAQRDQGMQSPGDSGAQGGQEGQDGARDGKGGNSGKNQGQPRGAQDYDRNLDGEGGQGYPGGAPDEATGQPGQGGLNAGGDVAQDDLADGKSKLEYLPGDARGDEVRTGALQLPGDPSRPFTLSPGSPEYKRAVEGAVLDPRLPPEYQELLRNYYR
jgi:hypothetical protein